MPAQFTLPPDNRSVGSGNPPADMNSVVDALTAQGAGFNVLNATYSGGADPTGVADSTTALQACVTAAAAAGRPMIIPPGTYKTTTTLNCKLTGLVIRAPGGPDNTIISCTGSNIPIAQFAGSYQDISGLTFTYATPQTSGQTAANCITFGDDSIGSCFQGNYHELTLAGGQTGMAIDPGITTVAGMFSCRLANIAVTSASSSFINLVGNNNLGGANCTGCVFENLYLASPGGTLAGTPVFLRNWDEVVFSQLNIEHCTVSSQDVMSLPSVGNAAISALHFEALTTSLNGGALLHLSNAGTVVINGLTAKFNVYTGSASNPVVKFFGTGPSTLTVNGFWESNCTVTTPSHPLIDFGTATNCYVRIAGTGASQTTVSTVNAGAGDYLQGGPPTAGVTPASAFTAFGTGGLNNVINSTSGADIVMVAGTWYYAALFVPFNATLTGFQVPAGSIGGTDNWIVALWPAAGGTALANSALAGTAAPVAATKKAFPFTASIAVAGPAAYIFGLQSNGTTARFRAFANAAEGFITGSVAGSFGTVPSLSPAGSYTVNLGPFASTY